MPRQVCLATAAEAPTMGKVQRFSFLERAPLRLKEHGAIWKVLTANAQRRLVVDIDHPEDDFTAGVLDLADLSDESRAKLEDAVATARAAALEVERSRGQNGPFAKDLNNSFDQQREWLALRSLLVQGLGQTKASSATRPSRKRRRMLLLLDT